MSKIPKRKWLRIQELKNNDHISLKNNSRVYCRSARKNKFLYVNELKAKNALKYNVENGAVRYYPCDSCMGFHLTSKTLEEYYKNRREFSKTGH